MFNNLCTQIDSNKCCLIMHSWKCALRLVSNWNLHPTMVIFPQQFQYVMKEGIQDIKNIQSNFALNPAAVVYIA